MRVAPHSGLFCHNGTGYIFSQPTHTLSYEFYFIIYNYLWKFALRCGSFDALHSTLISVILFNIEEVFSYIMSDLLNEFNHNTRFDHFFSRFNCQKFRNKTPNEQPSVCSVPETADRCSVVTTETVDLPKLVMKISKRGEHYLRGMSTGIWVT